MLSFSSRYIRPITKAILLKLVCGDGGIELPVSFSSNGTSLVARWRVSLWVQVPPVACVTYQSLRIFRPPFGCSI